MGPALLDKAFEHLSEAIRLDPENIALVISRAKVCATPRPPTGRFATVPGLFRRAPWPAS